LAATVVPLVLRVQRVYLHLMLEVAQVALLATLSL
jgi:hypothetical protein